jgi:hypothetical protein
MTETRPAHPPLDGDMTPDIGMMSTEIRLEHGYAGPDGTVDNTPALSFGFELECAEDDAGRAFAFVQARYACPNDFDGPGPWWDVTDDGDVFDVEGRNPPETDRVRVPMRIEFTAGPYLSDDETLEAWIDRAIAGTPFYRAYNEAVLFFTLQCELDEHLSPRCYDCGAPATHAIAEPRVSAAARALCASCADVAAAEGEIVNPLNPTPEEG